MAQSLTQIYLHIVFSTKNRQPLLQDPEIRHQAFAYLGGICRKQGSPSISVGGVEDHVHILCRHSKNISVADFIRDLKRDSSKWIKNKHPRLSGFHWQQGYGAFSISPAHVSNLEGYIAGQEEHHRKETFQDEFRRLCKKYNIEINEQYVWD